MINQITRGRTAKCSLFPYMLFLCLPFSYVKFFGHLILFELVCSIQIFILILDTCFRNVKIDFANMDLYVVAFAFYNLISVIIGMENLYESARYYRHMILVPVIVYFLLRIYNNTVTIGKCFAFLLPGTLFQTLLGMEHYIRTGIRPVNLPLVTSTVTLSILQIICLLLLIQYLFSKTSPHLKAALFFLCIFLLGGLMVFMTRGAIVTFVIAYPLSEFLLRSKLSQKLFLMLFCATILFSILLLSKPIGYKYISQHKPIQADKKITRIYSYDLYKRDLMERLEIWSMIFKKAMEKPIFGYGGYSYQIHTVMASSHNIFLSILLVSGIPGCACLILIIISCYKYLFDITKHTNKMMKYVRLLFITFTVFIVVALTNDFTGGRVVIFYIILSIITTLKVTVTRYPELCLNYYKKSI